MQIVDTFEKEAIPMKKIINKPENVVTEMLDGLAYVHSDWCIVLKVLTSS